MIVRIIWFALLMCFSLIAQAELFKCKHSDGSTSFQDQPCKLGTINSKVLVPDRHEPSVNETQRALTQQVVGVGGSWQEKEREIQRRRAEKEVEARNNEVKTYNRAQFCNSAKHQLGVLKEPRPVYRYDGKGERQYISDESRQAEIAVAEQRVAQQCD